MSKWMLIAGAAAFAVLNCNGRPAMALGTGNQHGFTGPSVPALTPMLGDYCCIGVKTADGQTDIPALLSALKQEHATDYMHLVWTEARYPNAWPNFKAMAPQFQQAGIRLWLLVTPPSETAAEPYGSDYVRWATECATIAKQYPCVVGLCIDDLCFNKGTFTTSYLKSMMSAAHAIDPQLSLLVSGYYYDRTSYLAGIVKSGAIDGLIFPYYPNNWTDTSSLLPEIKTYRSWLDTQTKAGGLTGKMPMVTMVYAWDSRTPPAPTPAYVQTCLQIGWNATVSGLADGVVTYCLPKNDPAFINASAAVYGAALPEPSTLVLLACGLAGLLCYAWRKRR